MELEKFKENHFLNNDDLADMQKIMVPDERIFKITVLHITIFVDGLEKSEQVKKKKNQKLIGKM